MGRTQTLEFAEKRIPEEYKKGYEMAKRLALTDDNTLQLEAIRYAESVIPEDQRSKY